MILVTEPLLAQVMQEIVAVASAWHIALPADVMPTVLAQLANFPPGGANHCCGLQEGARLAIRASRPIRHELLTCGRYTRNVLPRPTAVSTRTNPPA